MRHLALLLLSLAALDNALPQAGTTTCLPTMTWPGEASSSGGGGGGSGSSSSTATNTATSASPSSSSSSTEPRADPPPAMKTLPLCCCCLSGPPFDFDGPASPRYLGDCSKAGTRDVCGSGYTGASGFAMRGLEGHPEQIYARCSVSRCGPMRFVD
ncbi:hypothetical protein SAMD00023353_5000070 [Rosellinia necatrix]|uniref:Uncharacterized protein n=1 Tax=Rosellinia necatrix TaxID=77044 RepID=A0A1W2TQ37_ROSNE|nr:hypothetical protein SAMD00023353_5000070 [Rosellinia necatrix]